jgi:hypothetical protein
LQTAALVNEAYLKLVDQARADWRDRAQFLGVAARMMRYVLVITHASYGEKSGAAERTYSRWTRAWSFRRRNWLLWWRWKTCSNELAGFDPRKAQTVELR